ncbi:MAG: type II secretion system protein [Candidatus Roizmanbacteria bacterium]
MKLINVKSHRSFSLIEVLVVCTIIALLATLGVASYVSISRQVKDTKRIKDIEQARGMVELFKQSNVNSSYPTNLSELGTDLTAFKDNKGNSYYYSGFPSVCASSGSIPCIDFLFTIKLEDGASCYYSTSIKSGTLSDCPTTPPSN